MATLPQSCRTQYSETPDAEQHHKKQPGCRSKTGNYNLVLCNQLLCNTWNELSGHKMLYFEEEEGSFALEIVQKQFREIKASVPPFYVRGRY